VSRHRHHPLSIFALTLIAGCAIAAYLIPFVSLINHLGSTP
jgi:hypothetical protein